MVGLLLLCPGAHRAPAAHRLTANETGIDVGLKVKVVLITAAGDIVENPRHYRTAEQQLQKAQRGVSRRKTGSKRCRKAAQQCAKKHQHIRRPRSDFPHTAALARVRQYDVIAAVRRDRGSTT